MWHNFSGSNLEVTDGLINEFNETVGKEKGIVVSVTSLSYASDQNEKLMMIAAGDSGAPEMPDFTRLPCYGGNSHERRAFGPAGRLFHR